MKDLRSARGEFNGALAAVTGVKALLIAATLGIKPLLEWVLKLVYGSAWGAAYDAIADETSLPNMLLQYFVTVLCIFVPLALYFFFSRKRVCDAIPCEKPKLMQIGFGVGATVTIGYLANIGGFYFLQWLFDLFGLEDQFFAMSAAPAEYPINFWLVLLSVISVTVLPALLEEFLVRGVLLSATKKFGVGFSLVCSGFFFAFLHNTWLQIPAAFAVGIVLAYFTLRFRTIWIAVISHFILNINSVATSLILQHGGRYAEIVSGLWFFLIFPLMIGLTVAGCILYGIKRPEGCASAYSAKEKLFTLIKSPFFWLFILLAVFRLAWILITRT